MSLPIPPYGGSLLASVASTTPGTPSRRRHKLAEEMLLLRRRLILPLWEGKARHQDIARVEPKSVCCSVAKVRIIKPAPVSSTSESAISTTTSALRNRPRRNPPLTPRPESFNGSTMSRRESCIAGARPKSTPSRSPQPG